MRFPLAGGLLAALLASTSLGAEAAEMFNRVSSFETTLNLSEADRGSESVAEIISATEDGMTLVYTDSPQKGLGFVDIADPSAPKAGGFVKLEGEPTSVKVVGGKALVGVVTSASKTAPSGHLAVVDIATKTVESNCDLGGQPDSVAVAPDKSVMAIAIENERDEDLNEGKIPQLPAGSLAVLTLKDGLPDCATLKQVDMTGLAAVAGDDPEPEFVSINGLNEAVVTIQENNHIAIVDLAAAKVTAHFSAGAVDLKDIDTKKDGRIDLSGAIDGALREPDGAVWIDDNRFATANEGDYEGGSRGFTIWNKNGTVAYEAGASLEHAAIAIGHYNDKRNKKGIEIEGVEAGTYGDDRLIFVGSERASLVAVYKDTGGAPELVQLLPSGIGPEGLLALPGRNLFVTANETDLVEDGGVRAHVMIYARGEGPASYPTLVADNTAGKPIPFGALSGLAADTTTAGRLYAVTDSVFAAAPRILTIDATRTPAAITAEALVIRAGAPAEKLDLEGIATRPAGGFWLASEGHVKNELKNLLLKVAADGAIEEEIELPADLVAGMTSNGLEGVAVVGDGDAETVWLAVQREWKGDPEGQVMLLAYTPATKAWGVVRYPLEKAADGAWVGLSEITAVGDKLVLIERDNQIGSKAALKVLTEVSLAGLQPAPVGATDIPLVEKRIVRDLIPDLAATNGYILDKVEGFAVDPAGEAYVVTDNDGTDDSSGETLFLKIGREFAAR
ncbi:esterase-like activity of phytase family protein [Chthonobacter albigriseus]|uniref:esterase-like activity of phytase family protein n=1 Tax=Chthonobacter albigriseus TaxID=1683161 RepID=UPI0015EFAD2E|nr:esterase-like activity of phytase family protein [Chthonobacter albigriseus]